LITLAIDTSEARGSVAVFSDGTAIARKNHQDASDYSVWLLPTVDQALLEAGIKMERIDLLAVATGPGSFTGLRVGLTSVKAWAEVYGKPIVGVSRLEAMASTQKTTAGFIASCYDAQRGQLFAAIYRNSPGKLNRVGPELVLTPDELIQLVAREVGTELVTWITLDPGQIRNSEALEKRLLTGDNLLTCSAELVSAIAILAEESAANGQFSDPIALDANYVRRSDAEIFWKGSSAGVR
jgi:tRNA threonylcarbamoyladenosine biosynthesis protein TsaB